MVQSLKSLKTAQPGYFYFLNVVFVVGLFLLLYFYICKPCVESNLLQNGECVTGSPRALPAHGVSGDAAGRGIGWLDLMPRLV